MGRPIPQGRDRLGILGGPMGAAAALSDTDAEYTLGTSDFMVDGIAHIKWTSTASQDCYIMWCNDGAADWYFHVRRNYIGIWIDGGSYMSPLISGVNERRMHPVVFCDRSGNAYYYLNGEYIGATDISAKVASDLDGTVLNCGGVNGANQRCDALLQAKMHKFSGTFPTSDERAAIAMERYLNPDAESPTLAARANYATERRVDLNFVDVDQDGTTVSNAGTGGDFTIGGGFEWRDVRTQAERVAVAVPDDSWFEFDATHRCSNASADLGFAQGAYIFECVWKDTGLRDGVAADMWWIQNVGFTEVSYLYWTATLTWDMRIKSGAGSYVDYLYQDGYSAYARNGINVIHQVLDASAGTLCYYLNGHKITDDVAVAAALDLSGNIAYYVGATTTREGIMALRIWNWSGAVAPAAGWETTLLDRVANPWDRGADFDASAIKGEWLLRAGAQESDSTVIINQANPSVGDLTISGAGTIGNSTTLAVRGRS